MNDPTPSQLHTRKRNRNVLVLIAVMIFGSFLVAGLLRFSGWRPEGMKNKGELLEPPGDLRQVHPQLIEGGEYEWNPIERHWRIVVAPPRECGSVCDTLANDIDKVWQLTGREADRVQIFWLGQVPSNAPAMSHQRALRDAPALRAALPGADTTGPVTYIVDPNGFAILRYPPGHDPGDLRSDLSKLLKLK